MFWESDPLGIVQEIKTQPYEQVVFAQSRIRTGEKVIHKIFWDFVIQTDDLILVRRSDVVIKKKQKKPT